MVTAATTRDDEHQRARLEASLAAYRRAWTWLRDCPIADVERHLRAKIDATDRELDMLQQRADRAQLLQRVTLPRLRTLLERGEVAG